MQTPLNLSYAKLYFSAGCALLLLAIAYLDYRANHLPQAVLSGLLASLLICNSLYLVIHNSRSRANFFEWLFVLLLFITALVSNHLTNQQTVNIYWLYFYPIAVFFLFPIKQALLLLFTFIPFSFYIIFFNNPPLLQAQILFSAATISVVALFLAMVKSRTNTLLEPLISKDLETEAQKEKFLHPALSTEITRAEREGTSLLLMYVQIEFNKKNQRDSQLNISKIIARNIGSALRPFDQYYRLQQENYAIILPHTTTKDALLKINSMFKHNPPPKDKIKIMVGLASLNVGDTVESLISEAKLGGEYV